MAETISPPAGIWIGTSVYFLQKHKAQHQTPSLRTEEALCQVLWNHELPESVAGGSGPGAIEDLVSGRKPTAGQEGALLEDPRSLQWNTRAGGAHRLPEQPELELELLEDILLVSCCLLSA